MTDGDGTDVYTYMNQGYAGSAAPFTEHTYAQWVSCLTAFSKACENYRTTSLGLTGVYVGPTLADQGSIVSAQMADPVTTLCFSNSDTDAFVPKKVLYNAIPSSSDLILGTTPYVSNARDGFYVPYKLDDPDHWHRTDQYVTMRRITSGGDAPYHLMSVTTAEPSYPSGNRTSASSATDKDGVWLCPCDDNMSVTWITGISKSASFRVTIRLGIEVMTRPSSTLASFCEPPALPDEHAISMYREIASRMKDAYPSRDNDTGSLWEKIKNVASNVWDVVSPALSMTPLKPIVTGVNIAKKAIPVVREIAAGTRTLKAPKKGKVASDGASTQLQASAESAAERSGAASRAGGRRRKRQRKKKNPGAAAANGILARMKKLSM